MSVYVRASACVARVCVCEWEREKQDVYKNDNHAKIQLKNDSHANADIFLFLM